MAKMLSSYGLWIVVSLSSKDMWLCRCSGCNVEKLVNGRNLRAGASGGCRSCTKKGNKDGAVPKSDLRRQYAYIDRGVFYKEKRAVKHAMNRCNNSKHPKYNDYGGRGICVKFLDRSSFIGHLLTLDGHDNPSLVLDRINNDGHYEEGNLRFTTCFQSIHNRRKRKPRSQ